MLKYDLTKVLPHNHPMILIDAIIEINMEQEKVTTLYAPVRSKMFYDKEHNGVSSVIAIELMAQTIGCYAYFKNNEKEPQIGFLLGSRLLEISENYFTVGQTYAITAKAVFSDNNISSFDCIIKNMDDTIIANATINVYQSDNIKEQWGGVK